MKLLFVLFSAVLIVAASVANAGIDEGKAAYQRGDYQTAISEMQPLAAQGNTTARIILANMYLLGLGVQKNEDEAVKWYRQIANDPNAVDETRLLAGQGNASAQTILGFMLQIGRVVPGNDVEAVQWYRKAAEQGDYIAQRSLGNMYDLGRGVKNDFAEAVKWYRMAVDQGSVRVMHNLAVKYLTGQGVEKNEAEALSLLRKAADHGLVDAQRTLGDMYEEGRSVNRNSEEAVKWYQKAASQGDKTAQEYLRRRKLLETPQFGITTYWAEPIVATVVDEETSMPLEGVNVVAVWEMRGPYGGRDGGTLEIIEDVTDQEGKFRMPGWGPKAVPGKYRYGTRLQDQDPVLSFFKAGYRMKTVSNSGRFSGEGLDTGPAVRSSIWNGKVITLPRFKGSLKEYVSRYQDLYGNYGYGMECSWKKMPRAYVTLIKEHERMENLGVKPVPGSVGFPPLHYLDRLFSSTQCGSFKTFLEPYLK